MSRYTLRIRKSARRDLIDIYAHTLQRFGDSGRRRYRALIEAALDDLRTDPARNGVRRFDERCALYPIRFSRRRVEGAAKVSNARHLLAFRVEGDVLIVLRVLHDAMDLDARLDDLET